MNTHEPRTKKKKKKNSWKENYHETIGTPSWYTNAFNSVLIFFLSPL